MESVVWVISHEGLVFKSGLMRTRRLFNLISCGSRCRRFHLRGQGQGKGEEEFAKCFGVDISKRCVCTRVYDCMYG